MSDTAVPDFLASTPPSPCWETTYIDANGKMWKWDGSVWAQYPFPPAPNQLAVVTDTLVDIAKKLETVIAFQKEQLTALHHIQVRLDISAKPPPFKPPNIPLF